MATTLATRLQKLLMGFNPKNVLGPGYVISVGDKNALTGVDADRAEGYIRRRARYDNTYYLDEKQGGYRTELLKEQFQLEDDVKLSGVYNPISEIVDTYQNVFRGRWGDELTVAETVGGPQGRPVNPALTSAGLDVVGKIWRMSNMAVKKQAMQEIAANYGTVGVRVIAKPSSDPAFSRVFMEFDHPAMIVDYDDDSRGNVTDVLLEWQQEVGPVRDRRIVKVEERITKFGSIRKVDNKEVFGVKDAPNPLGVCPYIIIKHRDRNEKWGSWSYRGSETIIDALNLLFCNVHESVQEHIWATWFAAAAGEEPAVKRVGRHNIAYVQTMADQGSDPKLMPLVANLDFAGAISLGVTLIDALVARSPELLLTHIKALSGQSGETIAKLQLAAVARVESAKDSYEDGIIRAMKIAMSYGVLYGMWNLGSSMGSAAFADAAFNQGLEDFEFRPRPTFPESIYDKFQRAKTEQAQGMAIAEVVAKLDGIIPVDEKLKRMGYKDPEERKRIREQLIQDQKDGLGKNGQTVRNESGSNGTLDGGNLT